MTIELKQDGYWIVGLPESGRECGPYDTKAEAHADMRGLNRTYKNCNEKGYVTYEDNYKTT